MRFSLNISLAAAGLLASLSAALAQPPTVNYAQPSAITPGTATDVTFYGANLAGATALWTSLPATVELAPDVENNGTAADRVTYRITLPPEAAVGVGGYRLATGRGISSVRLLMIDDLPTAVDNGANKSADAAQAIELPTAIDGACEPESFDYYKFSGLAGQRLSVEAVARRLGSPLDPVIRLLDASGRELAYSDDEPSIGADCRFALQLPADGEYLLEIRDIRYQGSGAHRYRLRVGDFPLVTVPYPMSGKQGSVAQLSICHAPGDLTESGGLPAELAIPPGAATPQRLGVRYPAGQGSAWTVLAADGVEEAVELEPNDTPETASPVSLAGGINGRFDQPKDRDYYQFEAAAGARYLFVGQTRTLGSPSDLFMRLYKADGAQVAEVDDTGANEGILDYTFPEAGVYRLMAEDLHRRGGPEHAYRISIEPYRAGFSLAVEGEKFDAPQGGVFVAKVTCGRRDYGGPITLSLVGSDDQFALAGETIPEGKNETQLSVTLPSSLAAGDWRSLRVVGRATIGEQEFVAEANTLDALRGQLSGLPYPPAELDGQIGLGVGPVFPDFFKLSVDGEGVTFPQLVGSATFVVKAERNKGFEDPIAVSIEGLPPGFSAEVKPIEQKANETTVTLKGPAGAALATHRFRVAGSSSFRNQPRQVALDDVALRVIPPLEIALEPAGVLASGGAQKVKISARFFTEEKPAVTLQWTRLPAGVSGAETIEIEAGQTEVETELTAAPDASMGGALPIAATATAVIGGRQIVVQSGGTIETKMQ